MPKKAVQIDRRSTQEIKRWKVKAVCRILGIDVATLCSAKIQYDAGSIYDIYTNEPLRPTWQLTVKSS